MSIEIKSIVVVGLRFSDICLKTDDGIHYITGKIIKEVARSFEDGIIHEEEVTPELLSLIFDLKCFEYTNGEIEDSIIGLSVAEANLGSKNSGFVETTDYHLVEKAVRNHINKVDASLLSQTELELCVLFQTEGVKTI
jgi:hypothetical protein